MQKRKIHLKEQSAKHCLWQCSLAVPVLAGLVMLFVVLCPGTPEGSTGSGSGFNASQKTGQRLKVSSDRLVEAENRTCDPWFTIWETLNTLRLYMQIHSSFSFYSLQVLFDNGISFQKQRAIRTLHTPLPVNSLYSGNT